MGLARLEKEVLKVGTGISHVRQPRDRASTFVFAQEPEMFLLLSWLRSELPTEVLPSKYLSVSA